ncbi:MAG: hypothetical protein QOH61_1089, partial [Chloroflexota bacterium]|nr:hypothetical protein [Chloroflexota bacterium]
MRIAHVRELHAPAGAGFRLVAALPDGRWLDLEPARRRLLREDDRLAHNEPLFRVPLTTLDAVLASAVRVERLRLLVDPFLERPELLPPAGDHGTSPGDHGTSPGDQPSVDLALDASELRFGPPILRPA